MPDEAPGADSFTDCIEDCMNNVTLHISYMLGESSIAEALRVVTNALRFLFYGDERAFGFVATPDSFNEQALSDTLEWARTVLGSSGTGQIYQRMERLRQLLSNAETA